MASLIFDIETDGLLDTLTKVHSLVIHDLASGYTFSCTNHEYGSPDPTIITTDTGGEKWTIEDGLRVLQGGTEIIGHNIIDFDIPAIQKVYPWFSPKGKITDTLILSRLIFPDIKQADFSMRRARAKKHGVDENEAFPGKYIGQHGLESWGYRLNEWKGEYSVEREKELKAQYLERYNKALDDLIAEHGKTKALKMKAMLPPKVPSKEHLVEYVWGSWSPMMQTYCEQDVVVTTKLLKLLESKKFSDQSIQLEHDFKRVIHLQDSVGFKFDKAKGVVLEHTLMRRKAEIEDHFRTTIPPWIENRTFTPKVNNAKYGLVKGQTQVRKKKIEFNPGSRAHIIRLFREKYGWEPTQFTDKDTPVMDEDVLAGLPFEEAKLLEEYFLIGKRLGQLSEGNKAWLKLVKPNGFIYHTMITNGAVTGRCTHKDPNLGQVPSVDSIYGKECRELFGPPDGMVQVGADLSGLELRCLGHYMAKWDGGEYIQELLNGDIHTKNQLAAGLPTRANAKTFIYGFLYGAGAEKIGSIVGKGAAEGRNLIKAFLKGTPALKELREAVDAKAKRYIGYGKKRKPNPNYKGYLIGLDGRRLPIRHEHAALNTLLQSAGALIAKKAVVLLYQKLTTRGFVWGKDWAQMAMVHDEVQLWARPEIAEEVGKTCVEAFEQAGREFNFKCPITGEYKIGRNWAECH